MRGWPLLSNMVPLDTLNTGLLQGSLTLTAPVVAIKFVTFVF